MFDASQTLRSLRNRDLLVLQGSGRNASYVLGPAAMQSPDHLDPSTGHLPESPDHSWIESEIQRIAAPIASSGKASSGDVAAALVGLCSLTPMSTEDLARLLHRELGTVRRYVRKLVASGDLEPIFPQVQHPNQRYRATLKSLETAPLREKPL